MTISDLATRLGMSKKTIYLYFNGKEEIARAVVEATMERITEEISSANRIVDPVERWSHTGSQIKTEVMALRPIFLEDVQRFLPELWQHVEEFRAEKIMQFMQATLVDGQSLGVMKPMNPKLVSLIFMQAIQALVNPEMLVKYGFSVSEVIDTMLEIFIGGVAAQSSTRVPVGRTNEGSASGADSDSGPEWGGPQNG